MKKLLTLCALAALASTALAKLPAPSPEAKAKAAETAARTAWNGKSDGYKLCVAQDQVAAKYRASAAAAGKPVPTAMATPACTDPGPFVYAAAEPAKPLEASGAHSPATTAASPPSGAQPAAVTNPTPKQ
ncbi:hypothetical protein QTH89_16590 [Variovorax sp. J22G21]|uniref:hypothetical protein n=1 Tax=Variovorax fucosicus TaxID=3053517 RepID=UPI0025771627|nr:MULTISPECIES: hypothetical protein [unclassified Variovorax]MDM0038048.1 hypothetical protein [Variovorax sp. J22R193]MDM0062824.1 hypothetical protein [Variovorax sp. J22G21]